MKKQARQLLMGLILNNAITTVVFYCESIAAQKFKEVHLALIALYVWLTVMCCIVYLLLIEKKIK